MCTKGYFEKHFKKKKYGGFGRNVGVKGIRFIAVTTKRYNNKSKQSNL
jgi:hypothetical protein